MAKTLAVQISPDAINRYFEAAELNEKQKRLFMGMLADQYGWGGGQAVSEAFEVGRCTVTKGKAEFTGDKEICSSANRIRRPGGGRKPVEDKQQGIRNCQKITHYRVVAFAIDFGSSFSKLSSCTAGN